MRNRRGRPKSFDNDEILTAAMHYFWANGYDNSSLNELVKAMNIKKTTFYRTFKNKEELFELSLNIYKNEIKNIVTKMAKDIGVKQALVKYLKDSAINPKGNHAIKGCMLLNSGKECYINHPELSNIITLHVDDFIDFFATLIEEAKKNNELKNRINSSIIATRFITTFNGLIMLAQAGVSDDIINDGVFSIEELLS